MAKFTVDTHLFRELGELLVGRDSTALVELIKNAYDADATEVTVLGEELNDPIRGSILVTDNGVGMNVNQFENGFLRVASRMKDQGNRRSMLFQRRYTGAKGIGRLAAHKLAKKLEIDTVWRPSESEAAKEALYAVVDWDKVEQCETLDEVESADAIVLEEKKARKNASSGTTLILSRLRRVWTPTERTKFLADVQSFAPPTFLCDPLPTSTIAKPLLFSAPLVRDEDTTATAPTFRVNLEGDFSAGEDYWKLVAEVADWVLEIRADPNHRRVEFGVAPTMKTLRNNPEAKEVRQSIAHPTPDTGPYFDARVLLREGSLKLTRDQRTWAASTSGIRVYLEGFRILPYGAQEDDWLSIDADYTRRSRRLEMLKVIGLNAEGSDPNVGLVRVPNNNYFGAVFLTQNRCPDMRILVNREGFIPDTGFETLVRLVRSGIDLCTRARAAATYPRRKKKKQERRRELTVLADRLRVTVQLVKKAYERAEGGNAVETTAVLEGAIQELNQVIDLTTDLSSEDSLLLVLASVGTQMAAFVHEIDALLGTAQTIEHSLEQLLEGPGLSREQRRRLRFTLTATTDLRHGLERQASYLTDIKTPDVRRRRSRQRLKERFDIAVRFVQHHAELRRIKIDNRISPDLQSPSMFAAELTAVFTNLLTNAVKAAGENGRIRATATATDDQVRIKIQNTGVAMDLDDAERWFRPFYSTTSEINPVLGQGMGLGLTITRNLLESYGAIVNFVPPNQPFATAVEVALPNGNRRSS